MDINYTKDRISMDVVKEYKQQYILSVKPYPL